MIQKEFDKNLTSFLPDGVEGKRFLLAVSGGIDSMTMAELFLHSPLKPRFAVACVNFKLRGEDSDLDQASVGQWCDRNGVRFHTIEFDTKGYAHTRSLSTQMAARELRYSWFYKLMEEYGYDYLSVAHNQDDSVETLFLNLLRGTGLKGLAGIRSSNGVIIRPMLSISREMIREFVNQHNISYRDDKTNFETHYSRNRIRNVVFPELRKINPSFLDTITRGIEHFIQAEELLDEIFESKRGTLYKEEDNALTVNIAELLKEGHKGYWLYRILGEKGFNSAQITEIGRALNRQPGKVFTSLTHRLEMGRGEMVIFPIEGESTPEELLVSSEGEYHFGNISFALRFFEKDEEFSPYPRGGKLYFSADDITLPLVCRVWRDGDRFRPFGMKGFKKLSDFYTDIKFDKREKDSQPILFNGDEVVCLPGLRIDDRYKIKTSTRLIAEVVIL